MLEWMHYFSCLQLVNVIEM